MPSIDIFVCVLLPNVEGIRSTQSIMKYAQVKYKGAEDKIGTHGTVKTGQMLKLTEEEYDCVRDDDRYEFKKWEKVKLPPRNPVGRARHTTLGTTETSGASEDQASASRVSQRNF